MDKDLIKKLKPLVTAFSEEIRLKYKHGDEVSIGGVVTNIFDLSKLLLNDKSFIQLDIDDRVGIISVLVPAVVYTPFNGRNNLKIGDIILANGKVYAPNGQLEKEAAASVICWHLELLESKELE